MKSLNARILGFLVVLGLLAPEAFAQPAQAAPQGEVTLAQAEQAVQGAPAQFVENVGQFDARARFMLRGGAAPVFVADDAVWVTLVDTTGVQAEGGELPDLNGRPAAHLRLSFVGANAHPRVEGFDPQATELSYYRGEAAQWRTRVPVWGGVRYVELYPGVDLEVRADGGFAWALVARDAAALSRVRLRVDGADGLALAGPVLDVQTAVGQYRLPLLDVRGGARVPATAARVTGLEVSAPFAAAGVGPAGFAPVVVPTNYAGTYLGGSQMDWVKAIAANGSFVYMAGATYSPDFPGGPGPYPYRGHFDAFAGVMSNSLSYGGFQLGMVLLGATGNIEDRADGLVLLPDGFAITGDTKGTGFPVTNNAYDTTYNSAPYPWGDVFVTRFETFNTTITLAYSTYVGGADRDESAAIGYYSADPHTVYVVGSTGSTNFPVTPGAYRTTAPGGNCGSYTSNDAFAFELFTEGYGAGQGMIYSTYLGGSNGCDYAMSLAPYQDPNHVPYLFIGGYTSATNLPTTSGALQPAYGGGSQDGFVIKLGFSRGGQSDLRYATYLGGSGLDQALAIGVDGSGTAYLTGRTASTNFPTRFAYRPTLVGGVDAFVTRLLPNGDGLVFSTYLGGNEDDAGNALYVDAGGYVHVAGKAGVLNGGNFPISSGGTPYGGLGDAFYTAFGPWGTFTWSTFLGGSSSDEAYGLANYNGRIYLAGITYSTNFPVLSNSYQRVMAGVSDGFIGTPQLLPPTDW